MSDFVSDDSKPIKSPLDLVLCTECTLLQLGHTVDASKLYTEHYGYRSGINNTIRADLKEIVTKAKMYHHSCVVVDIGANDGTLLSFYPDKWGIIKVAYEPVKKFAKEIKADHVVADFFTAKNYPLKEKAKIITAISMFYDLDDPNTFVKDIATILDDNGVLIIQQNYLAGMLQQHAYDNVVHEHLEYYSLTSLEHLLNRHGLEVFDVTTNDINGGSFRVFVRHMDRVKKMRLFEKRLRLDNKFTYAIWGMQVNALRNKLHTFVNKVVSEGKTVYLYGASTRGNTLIQFCGLDNTLVKAAVERNPEKWGKKIASMGIPIISEEQARKEKPDYMIVLPWFFKKEFLEREKEYLKHGHFIFPLPEFEVV